jgi:hypothetical protein
MTALAYAPTQADKEEVNKYYEDIVEQRGGKDRFSVEQDHYAKLIAMMMYEQKYSETPQERVRAADAIDRIAARLPPVLTKRQFANKSLKDMDTGELARAYSQSINGSDDYTEDETLDNVSLNTNAERKRNEEARKQSAPASPPPAPKPAPKPVLALPPPEPESTDPSYEDPPPASDPNADYYEEQAGFVAYWKKFR